MNVAVAGRPTESAALLIYLISCTNQQAAGWSSPFGNPVVPGVEVEGKRAVKEPSPYTIEPPARTRQAFRYELMEN